MGRGNIDTRLLIKAMTLVVGIILIVGSAIGMNGYDGSADMGNFIMMMVGTGLVVAGLFPVATTAKK